MASTVQGDLVSSAYMLLTDQLRVQYEKRAREIMLATLDPRDIDGTQVAFIANMLAEGREISEIYKAISLNYMALYGEAEGVNTPKETLARIVVPFDSESFTKRIVGAGILGYKRKLGKAGLVSTMLPESVSSNPLFIQCLNNTSKDFSTHAMRSGRNTVVLQSNTLPAYSGWGRTTSPGACDFCLMLATRDNYRTDRSASFAAHRSCSCSPEPRTPGWTPDPESLKAYGRFLDNEERLNNELGKENRAERKRDRRDAREVERGDISGIHAEHRKDERTARKDKEILEDKLSSGIISDEEYKVAVREIEAERIDRTKFYQDKKTGEDYLTGKMTDEEYEAKLAKNARRAEEKKAKNKPEGHAPGINKKEAVSALLG